jgi:HAD superfamily hydrolase (TIGR01509 family)
MEKIKTVIFDWAGVFCSPGELFSHPRLLAATGLTAEEMEKRVKPMQNRYYRGEVTAQDFWRCVFEEFDLDGFTIEELNDAYFASSKIYPDVLAIPPKLKNRYTVALLSNLTEAMMNHILDTHELRPRFHRLFFSNQIGRLKPEPESFEHVLKELHADPATTLFIDDSKGNLEAAKKLGMQTLLCETPEQLIADLKTEGILVE